MSVNGLQRPTAADIARGVARLLLDLEIACLPEFTLRTGRRVDLMGLHRDGRLWAIEIKSSREDFLTDRKWRDYLGFADRFLFAVAPGFPQDLLPAEEGLILADRHEAHLARPAQERPLAPARRKALTLRFARTAAMRLQDLADPIAEEGSW